MVRPLQKLSDVVNRIVIAACVGCVLAMLSISFIGFFYMAITGAALSWTYSLARLFIPWIGMLSITVAFKAGEHVALTMFVRLLPRPVAQALRGFSVAAIAVFALLLVWFGWDFFSFSTQMYMVSDRIQIDGRWVAACVPVTGTILLIHLVNGVRLLEPLEPEAIAEHLIRSNK